MRPIKEEIDNPDWSPDIADELLCDPDGACLHWLIAMKAFEGATSRLNVDFGEDQAKIEEELSYLRAESVKIFASMGQDFDLNLQEKYLREILRFGKSKVHNISAFLGGVASQEACKLLMSQYLPMKHTYVYDGIHGSGEVYDL